jgi:uncharacterized protein YdhG (YjbR/CyaY superfamily)
MKQPKDVDSYIAAFPKDVRIALSNLRKTIKTAAPKAQERISYRMPFYYYHGRLAYFAGFKDHCSFFIMGKSAEKYSKELKPYMATAHTAHFTPKKPLPTALVKKIIKDTMKTNEQKHDA